MLSFFKIRIYKKNFYTILIILITVSILLSVAATYFLYKGKENQNYKDAISVSSYIEKSITNYQRSIDSFAGEIYNSNSLLTDFIFFLESDAKTYYEKHLLYSNQANRLNSIITSCKNFSKSNNDFISQINFISNNGNTNIIKFTDTGTAECKFGVSSKYALNSEASIEKYFIYEKKLPNPEDINKSIGTLQFVMKSNKLLNLNTTYPDLNNICVINNRGKFFVKSLDTDLADYVYDYIYTQKNSHGTYHSQTLSLAYSNISVPNYNINIITTNTTLSVYKSIFYYLIIIYIGIVLLSFIILTALAIRLNYDAIYLNKILSYIGGVKEGNFNQEPLKERNDEYGLITEALENLSFKINNYIDQEYKLKLKQQETEMKALEHQINPHFLYNTLEIIRSKAYIEGNSDVAEAVYNLGVLYRSIVKNNSIVTIEIELSMLLSYLKLMEFKYSNNFYYQIDIPQEIRELNTVKFWMQPLVENFIQHGFSKENNYNLILILGDVQDDYYSIKFIDNGTTLPEEKIAEINKNLSNDQALPTNNHIGMKNVYTRLKYLYGEKLIMTISNNTESGICIEIKIPRGDI